ncbi:Cell division coordinator CpoB [Thalassocella blandensis]|nr:Cell division coordinator CpoB [Thalassocella blandensis]
MMMYKVLIAATLGVAAFSVSAQVEIVDRPISSANAPTQKSTTADSGGANVAELYYQFQVLQQEVQQLRGMVEEQNHQIKKLKQQRLDDYLDLDRRISAAGGNSESSTTSAAAPTSSSSNDVKPVSAASSAEELKSYKQAINLLLKEQKHDAAIAALKQHLQDYPDGRYSANAQYWLGEIYLVKNDLSSAAQWFEQLLRDSPKHSKAPDAQFKLAKVYHMQGNNAAAKTLLQQVIATNSNAAQLAKDYLDRNF